MDYSAIKVSGKPLTIGSGFYLHALFYFIAAVLFHATLSDRRIGRMLVILLILFGVGIVFEIIQIYLPKRTCNPMDIVANGVGLGAFFIWMMLNGVRIRR